MQNMSQTLQGVCKFRSIDDSSVVSTHIKSHSWLFVELGFVKGFPKINVFKRFLIHRLNVK